MSDPSIRLDPDATEPPFDQIRAQLARGITDGSLVAGTRLPTVRALAEQLGVATNTAARAYRELEAAGLVETRGRAGTVVSSRGDVARERVRSAAGRYAQLSRESGLTADEALAIVRAALDN